MSDTKQAGRVAWMDLARVVAAFWVVSIHVAAVPVVHMQAVPIEWWWWANVYNCLSRCAVPMFVMLSGALLLSSPQLEMGVFFKKRASKLLIPMLGWTAIYEAWRVWLRHDQVDAAEVFRNLVDGLHAPAYPHLWFLWIIASLYLLTPVLHPFVQKANIKVHVYFAGLWFVSTAMLPLIQKTTGWQVGLMLHPAFGYVGYYIVGASLHRFGATRLTPHQQVFASVIYVAGAGLSAWGTYALSVGQGRVNEAFMEPLSGMVMLMSISAFLLLRHLGAYVLQDETWRRRASSISLLSFGIYLSHPLILDLLDLYLGLALDPMRHHTALYVPFMALIAFACAAALTAVLRGLPGLRRLVP